MRKRDLTPPGMAQASLYDAADHPNSLLHRKWWLDAAEHTKRLRVTLNPASGWGSTFIAIATFVGLWRGSGGSGSNDAPAFGWQPRQQQIQTQKAAYRCWNHTRPQPLPLWWTPGTTTHQVRRTPPFVSGDQGSRLKARSSPWTVAYSRTPGPVLTLLWGFCLTPSHLSGAICFCVVNS